MGSRDLDMKQGLQAEVGGEPLRTRVRPTWEPHREPRASQRPPSLWKGD